MKTAFGQDKSTLVWDIFFLFCIPLTRNCQQHEVSGAQYQTFYAMSVTFTGRFSRWLYMDGQSSFLRRFYVPLRVALRHLPMMDAIRDNLSGGKLYQQSFATAPPPLPTTATGHGDRAGAWPKQCRPCDGRGRNGPATTCPHGEPHGQLRTINNNMTFSESISGFKG